MIKNTTTANCSIFEEKKKRSNKEASKSLFLAFYQLSTGKKVEELAESRYRESTKGLIGKGYEYNPMTRKCRWVG